MKNEIIKLSKTLKGKVLLIGSYDNKVLNNIEKNSNIVFCDILSKNSDGSSKKGFSFKKKFYLSNLRKKYKKKKINYILVDEREINKLYNNFIKDSIYITKNEIIYICSNDSDIGKIENRYKRYKTNIEIKKFKNGKIIKINTEKAKTNIFKDLFYKVVDLVLDIVDIIGDILVS